MKEIKLTQEKVALVDDEDYELVNEYKWYFDSKGYAARNSYTYEGRKIGKTILMHREISKAPTGIYVDHKDHNKLNNQKCNLRLCTRLQNQRNLKKPRRNTASRFKGVTICFKSKGQTHYYYKAQIKIGGGRAKSKYFPFTMDGEIMAARQYDEWAKQYFGEYAYLNNPTPVINEA